MTYFQSILLGLVQGLGEFLPISSSAHLVIVPWAFHFPDPGLTFDVALHFGTLFALIAYFWKDWMEVLTGALKNEGHARTLFFLLMLTTVPGAFAGFVLEKYAEEALRHPLLIATNMVLLGILLFAADQKKNSGQKNLNQISFWDALIVGLSQALALVPGVSRSGITMTTGLFRGFSRVTAAQFSFLMAAPITFGACLLKAPYFFKSGVDGPVLAGIAVSTLTGFLSIKYLLKYLQFYGYQIFVYYRLIFAAVVFLIYLWH